MKAKKDNLEAFNIYPKWYQEAIINLGMEITWIVEHYAITDEELIECSKDVADYITYTRNKNIRAFLFDGDRPRYIKDGKVI